LKPWEPYINSVLGGERLAGRLERLAVERAVRLGEKYSFNEEEAQWAIDVISSFKHTKGDYRGMPFQLLDWQKFFIAYLFGVKKPDSGLRLFRKVLLVIAKKGGKSELGGAIAKLMSFYDGEQAAECYTVANKRDQAKFSFDSAKVMTQFSQAEGVLEDVVIYDSHVNMELRSKTDGSFFRAIAADAKTLDGVFPHFGLVDEYHEASDTAIPDNLESGMVSRGQPMLMIITTRGFNIKGPLWQLEQNYIQILEGVQENDEVFPLIFAMDDEDDPYEEKNWEKSNPGIGQTPTWEGLRSQFATARTEGSQRLNSFMTKNLNRWERTKTSWIKLDDYRQAGTDFDEEMLRGRLCFAGLDLATVRDLTAWALVFPPTEDDPIWRLLVRSFCPEENALERSKKDKAPYLDWEGKWLTMTPGNVTDYEYVESQMRMDFEKFDVQKAYYDRFNSSDLIGRLMTDDYPLESFAQTFANFNSPICLLEKTILAGDFDHQNNPVVEWCFQNVVLKQDAGGNVRFDKSNSKEKIDAAVAVAMGFAAYMSYEAEEQYSGEIDTW
jgi:phage terminase large subunit-like protein